MIGREIASRVIDRFGTNDLKTLVRQEGLEVRTRDPWQARCDDAYVYPIIFVPKGLHATEFRTRVAHCLGHHFMHAGNQVWLTGFDGVWSAKQERQAEEFAAWLTLPASVVLTNESPGETARRYRVTEGLVQIRLA